MTVLIIFEIAKFRNFTSFSIKKKILFFLFVNKTISHLSFYVSSLFFILGVSLHLVTAKCGAQDIRKNIGFREYYRFGETSQERCRYTFNPPPDEDSLFILDIKHYRAFRQGTRQNAYLTMPDGKCNTSTVKTH